MKRIRSDLALHRILGALEADLLAMPGAEIEAIIAETGMSAKALLSDSLGFMKIPSPLKGEVGDAEHRRVGGWFSLLTVNERAATVPPTRTFGPTSPSRGEAVKHYEGLRTRP